MGTVVDLATHRRERTRRRAQVGLVARAPKRPAPDEPMRRLEVAIAALGPLVRGGKVQRRTETELLAAIGEVTTGAYGAAAARLERLAARLTTAAQRAADPER
ncbi:MAG: hypothetical protein ACKOI0_01855 [Actinomycetota bacterium]